MKNKNFTTDEITKLEKAGSVIDYQYTSFQKLMWYIDSFNNLGYTPERFFELKEMCKVIFDNIPFMISMIDETIITGARKNEKSLFSSQEEISYNRNLAMFPAGRFNLENEPVFYGCLPTFRENGVFIDYENQCPMFEVCKEIGTHEGLRFPVFFTLGFWKVTRRLTVLNLCFEEGHLTVNRAIHKPIKSFTEILKTHTTEKVFQFIKSVWEYFSALSRKWNNAGVPNCYYVLTALSKAFEEHYKAITGKECDGIIYPSEMMQAKGLNIVLRPATVDQCLELQHVQMYTLKSRGLPYDYQPITKLIAVKDDCFEFDPDFVSEYTIFTDSW